MLVMLWRRRDMGNACWTLQGTGSCWSRVGWYFGLISMPEHVSCVQEGIVIVDWHDANIRSRSLEHSSRRLGVNGRLKHMTLLVQLPSRVRRTDLQTSLVIGADRSAWVERRRGRRGSLGDEAFCRRGVFPACGHVIWMNELWMLLARKLSTVSE